MPEIILTEEQAKRLIGGFVPVVVKDLSGRVVGRKPSLSSEMVAELKRRAATSPFYSGDQMRERLQALETEWQRVGGFDTAYALAFLERLNSEDPGSSQKQKQIS